MAGKCLARRANPLRGLFRDHAPLRKGDLHRLPCRKTRGVAPSGPAADKALGEAAPRHVEMAKYTTKLAGREQTGDGLPKNIEDALLGAVHSLAMGVGGYRQHLGTV